MKRTYMFYCVVACAASLSVAAAWAAPKKGSSGGLSAADKKFVKEAAQGGMAEVTLGQLATKNASNQQVKDFGQRMVDDHSKANDELKSLAQQKGVMLPSTTDAKDKGIENRMAKLTGAKFDKAYMSDMVTDHMHDVASFEREANNGKDPDVKAWAAKTLPTLREHLKMARETKGAVTGMSGHAAHSKMKK